MDFVRKRIKQDTINKSKIVENEMINNEENIKNKDFYKDKDYNKEKELTEIEKKEEEEKILLEKLAEKYNEIFRKLKIDNDKELFELELERDQINKKLYEYDIEIKKNKLKLRNVKKHQKDYYLDILEKGIDVRSDGLVWVVRKILELNIYLDYSHFPKFLDKNQIDYLIFLAKKYLNISHNISLMESLKSKSNTNRKEKESKEADNNNINIDKNSISNSYSNSNNNLIYIKNENKEINLSNKSFESKGLNISKENLDKKIIEKNQKENENNNDKKDNNRYENSKKIFDFIELDNPCLSKEDNITMKEIKSNNDIKIIKNNYSSTFISKIINTKIENFYLKSFSEKALFTLQEIFKNHKLLDVKYYNQITEEDIVYKIKNIFFNFYLILK
jgi:hypothetical protein